MHRSLISDSSLRSTTCSTLVKTSMKARRQSLCGRTAGIYKLPSLPCCPSAPKQRIHTPQTTHRFNQSTTDDDVQALEHTFRQRRRSLRYDRQRQRGHPRTPCCCSGGQPRSVCFISEYSYISSYLRQSTPATVITSTVSVTAVPGAAATKAVSRLRRVLKTQTYSPCHIACQTNSCGVLVCVN